MIRRPLQWTLATVLILTLTLSCASSADLDLASPTSGEAPTPTPFQPEPGVYDLPFFDAGDPQAVATYTPYPTTTVYQNGVFNPQILPPDANVNPLFSAVTNPLTGLPASEPLLLERRPIAIKVANFPRYVRPQSGLTLADVVFEYYIEDLLTRFIAVFYGNDTPMAGPVRSGRYFDEHVLRMYHSFFVFKFADPREYDYFKASDFADFLVVPGAGACPPYRSGKSLQQSNQANINGKVITMYFLIRRVSKVVLNTNLWTIPVPLCMAVSLAKIHQKVRWFSIASPPTIPRILITTGNMIQPARNTFAIRKSPIRGMASRLPLRH
jgi:hypothetical protein